MDVNIVIAAAGLGTRTGQNIPKQFILIEGKPIIIHTIEKFDKALPNARIFVTMHPDWLSEWEEMRLTHFPRKKIQTVAGGVERYHSIKNALAKILPTSITGVHDAARPLLSMELIQHGLSLCLKYGSAIPYIPVTESLRKIESGKNSAVNRKEYVLIQTPQFFKSSTLIESYKQEYQETFTDDASVVESAGFAIHLYNGESKNIKVTTQADLDIVTFQLSKGK